MSSTEDRNISIKKFADLVVVKDTTKEDPFCLNLLNVTCTHKLFTMYRRPSLFAGVTFKQQTANTKSNNDLKVGVPFLFFLKIDKYLYIGPNFDFRTEIFD